MKNRPTVIPRYMAKVPRFNPFLRLSWWLLRRYCLNEDHYRLIRRYTGPRPRWAHSTLKKDATAYRFYMEPRRRAARINYEVPR